MKLQVLVGMIASGKSSYARNAANHGVVSVNDDAIVSMLHAGKHTLYSKSLKPLYKAIENAVASTALAMRLTVIIDRGVNVSVNSRKRWTAIARSLDAECEALVFPKQFAHTHAERRFASDPRGQTLEDWLAVADRHHAEYQEPTKEEGFSEIRMISLQDIQRFTVYL